RAPIGKGIRRPGAQLQSASLSGPRRHTERSWGRMDHTRKSSQRTIVRSFVLLLGGVALGALWRSRAAEPAPVEPERPQLALPSAARPARSARRFGTRLGIAAAFVALFV